MNQNFQNNDPNFQQNRPQGPNNNMPYSPNPNNPDGDLARLKNAQKNMNIANVCAAISFVIGSVLLSAVALGFAFTGRKKLKACSNVRAQYKPILERLVKLSKVTWGLCIAALVFNVFMFIYVYPIVMEAVQNGGIETLFGRIGTSAATSSVWG